MSSLYKKLHQIQCAVRGLGKDSCGGGTGASSYQFVSGSKVLDTVRPKMDELGVLLVQQIDSIECTRTDYSTRSGNKSEMFTKVMMTFTWIDSDTGEKLSVPFGANGQNGWDKGLGSALTYAERYFLLKFFHIATDEDDVDALPVPDSPPAPPLPPLPPAHKPKKEMNDKQLQQAIDKINTGDLAILDKCKDQFSLKQYQLHALDEAVNQYKINNNSNDYGNTF